ncbi:protein yellow-related [Holotrichia oblita]|uniref:Protein yellow-related n=1 Tax=Holotrichia oblita TaxID=644536 RepID=A0ACB9SMH1_HOLOL|nr:protein yellow-related [Holotrichia oblita]
MKLSDRKGAQITLDECRMVSKLIVLATIFFGQTLAVCDRNYITDLSFKVSGSHLTFPCESTKNIYLQSGRYISKNIIGTRMQIYKDEAFIALPRYKTGVPFTLAKFSLRTRGCVATLTPYPCWSLQEEGNCKAIQSAVDICIDQMDILWVLDSGICNTLEQPVRRCAPKLIGIELKTGQVVKMIDLSNFVTPESRLQYLVIDYAADGHAFAYISDAGARSIIVYNIMENKGYRVVLPKPCCACAPDVLYLCLVRTCCGNELFFTYLSGNKIYKVKCGFLQSGQAAGAIVECGIKPVDRKIVLLGTDNGAAIFFRYKGESDIYIWNTETCFKAENGLLVQKGNECRLPTEVVPGYKRLMWVIESNFPDYVTNTVGCLGASVVVHPLVKTCD